MIRLEKDELEGTFHDDDVASGYRLGGGVGQVEFHFVGAVGIGCFTGEVVAYLHGGAPLCVVFCDDGTIRAVLNQCFRVNLGFGSAVNFDDADVAGVVPGEVDGWVRYGELFDEVAVFIFVCQPVDGSRLDVCGCCGLGSHANVDGNSPYHEGRDAAVLVFQAHGVAVAGCQRCSGRQVEDVLFVGGGFEEGGLKGVSAGNSGGAIVQCEVEVADGEVAVCVCVVESGQVKEDGDGSGSVEGLVNGEWMHFQDVTDKLDVEPGFVDAHAGGCGPCQGDTEFQAIVAGGFVSEYSLVVHRE